MTNQGTIAFDVLGGGGEVGASCFQLRIGGHQIILDSGTHPKKEGFESLPEFSLLSRAPDAVIISHGHVDHVGSLPYLSKQFPHLKTYATTPTARIMDRMLHNSVSVMTTIRRERGIEAYPLYDHEDVAYVMRGVRGQEYNQPFTLPLETPIEVTFHPAGHVLGSASVLLKTPGHNLFYTADICETDQELMEGFAPHDFDVPIDTLIIESTHGATEETRISSYEEETTRLGESMAAVLRGGGSVLIPCFALGRMQEILNIVARLQEEGKVPRVPIYASGLGRAIYELYDRFFEYLSPEAMLRPLDLFGRIGNVWEPQVVNNMIESPCILVATSGMMLENTPSALIAEQMVKQNHHGIFFVGYLDHETLGYKLLHAEKGAALQFVLGRQPVEVKLENVKRFHFSAHAPRKALKRVVERLHPKNVIYVHGDPDALRWMQDNTGNGARTFAPTVGQTIILES